VRVAIVSYPVRFNSWGRPAHTLPPVPYTLVRACIAIHAPGIAGQWESVLRAFFEGFLSISKAKSPRGGSLVKIQSDSVKLFNIAATVLIGACGTFAPDLRARVPPVLQADETAVLEGTMEVLIEDSDQGSRILYFLTFGDRRVALRFMSPPANLTTGTRVRVRGRWAEDGQFIVTTFERL
jgi:hypothetical protein